ncbi:hypothetical protein CAEBREN_10274 [Caenorhabditis brenneri]|uniref:aECM cysteine-cradle domain-containing protein n=1 Tax=Caenorhabditis brenneri TaxID=135651 RepID=G0M8K4_CAEBE|nr:hypothetical protein CAEBREN_10274 [Caenorhabditis brenneri]
MTNEISMPSLGHKEGAATFHRLQPKDGISPRFRSARFERLRGSPDNIKPIFVKPAVLETEEPHNPTPIAPIEVVPSSETVTETPIDFVPTSDETPAPLSFTEFNIESMPIFKETDEPSTSKVLTTPEQPTTSEEPSTFEPIPTTEQVAPSEQVATSEEPSTFEPIPTTEEIVPSEPITPTEQIATTQPISSFESVSTPELVTPSAIVSPTSISTEQTSQVSRATPAVHQYAQERVFPTAFSVQPPIEFIEVQPKQIEVASTNAVEVELPATSTVKAFRKRRRHRRKHRKLRKTTKATEAPTEIPTELPTQPSTETPTENPTSTDLSTIIDIITEASSTETSTTPTTTPTSTTTQAPTTTPTTTHVQTFPTSGSTGAKIGESYLGGWNEDEGIIVTTSGPSLGSAINQFSEVPASIPIDDDRAIKAYYEKYYAEWYEKHNQAVDTPGEPTPAAVPREIKIELAKPTTSSIETATSQPFEISSSTSQPTKEQLDKVCDYVAKIAKSFGIKDLVGFTKNNCSFVKSFHPTATCEQIQHLMSYCVTGVFVSQ